MSSYFGVNSNINTSPLGFKINTSGGFQPLVLFSMSDEDRSLLNANFEGGFSQGAIEILRESSSSSSFNYTGLVKSLMSSNNHQDFLVVRDGNGKKALILRNEFTNTEADMFGAYIEKNQMRYYEYKSPTQDNQQQEYGPVQQSKTDKKNTNDSKPGDQIAEENTDAYSKPLVGSNKESNVNETQSPDASPTKTSK